MQIDHMGGAVPEHVDHANCRTTVKMDNLWECLTVAAPRCPDQVVYGPVRYCTHTNHAGFGARAKREDSASDR